MLGTIDKLLNMTNEEWEETIDAFGYFLNICKTGNTIMDLDKVILAVDQLRLVAFPDSYGGEC